MLAGPLADLSLRVEIMFRKSCWQALKAYKLRWIRLLVLLGNSHSGPLFISDV
jgi:hypothetical protein